MESYDLYKNLKENESIYNNFDFSNYRGDYHLYSKNQKLETLKFKDELGRNIVHSFIALKSKLYSIATAETQKMSVKGTTKFAQKLHSIRYYSLPNSCQ